MSRAAADAFSDSYAQARSRFLQSAKDAGLAVESRPHPLKGRDGEELAMDVARLGPPDAGKLLIVSSALTLLSLSAVSDRAALGRRRANSLDSAR